MFGIFVSNSGAPISESQRKHMFENLSAETGRKRRRGIGIGLHFCKRVLEALEGGSVNGHGGSKEREPVLSGKPSAAIVA